LNLALNARDAMPQGGRLLLEVDEALLSAEEARAHPRGRPGAFVRLRVADTGPGIPPQLAGRLFEPLTTTNGPGEGTGLGLAVVGAIVGRHRGGPPVPPAPGAGTEFEVYLPPGAEAAAAAPGPAEAPVRPSAARVLVAEDEPDLRRVTGLILERGGHRVLSAEDGRQAPALCAGGSGRSDPGVVDQKPPRVSCAGGRRAPAAGAPRPPLPRARRSPP